VNSYDEAVVRDALTKLVEIRDVRDFEFLLPSEADALIRIIEEVSEPGSSAAVADTDATPQDGDGPETVGERQGRQPGSLTCPNRPEWAMPGVAAIVGDGLCVHCSKEAGEWIKCLADSNWCERS
jgi:hypothetical protein